MLEKQLKEQSKKISGILSNNINISNIVGLLSVLSVGTTIVYHFLKYMTKIAVYNYYKINADLMIKQALNIGELCYGIVLISIYILCLTIHIVLHFQKKEKRANSSDKKLVSRISFEIKNILNIDFFKRHICIILLLLLGCFISNSNGTNFWELVIIAISMDFMLSISVWIWSLFKVFELIDKRNSILENIIYCLIAAAIVFGLSWYIVGYTSSNNLENKNMMMIQNEEFVVIDTNGKEALVCRYKNAKIDCDDYTKIINLDGYYLYKYREKSREE